MKIFVIHNFYKKVKEIIKNEQPDIVHVHTFFPLLSPSVLYAAKKSGCKVVATLHDTRFICPCANSMRGAELCNKCGDGHYFRMCLYKCFKDSSLQSFIVSIIFKYHRIRRSFYKQIDKYICLNNSQINLLLQTGFDKKKIMDYPNVILFFMEGLVKKRVYIHLWKYGIKYQIFLLLLWGLVH